MSVIDNPAGLEFWVSVADGPKEGSIVTVFGELDAATAPRLRTALQGAIDRPGDVEVDLRGCGYVDSSGIAILAWAAWRLKDHDRKLILLGAGDRVRKILDLTGIGGHSAVVIDSPG